MAPSPNETLRANGDLFGHPRIGEVRLPAVQYIPADKEGFSLLEIYGVLPQAAFYIPQVEPDKGIPVSHLALVSKLADFARYHPSIIRNNPSILPFGEMARNSLVDYYQTVVNIKERAIDSVFLNLNQNIVTLIIGERRGESRTESFRQSKTLHAFLSLNTSGQEEILKAASERGLAQLVVIEGYRNNRGVMHAYHYRMDHIKILPGEEGVYAVKRGSGLSDLKADKPFFVVIEAPAPNFKEFCEGLKRKK